MKTRCNLLALAMAIGLVFPAAARAGHGFERGHIFVSVREADACDFGGREAIVEIDPTTGTATVFADSDDGICLANGVRFTPDLSQLYALNFGHLVPVFDGGWVQAFNPDGTSGVILDASDGIFSPNGANALAFDSSGDLYVLNDLVSTILRFPADGGPATVFADASDGVLGRGALDFAPNGDLFYAALTGNILRITPAGESSVFDTLPSPSSLVFDAQGNLFVAAGQAGVGPTIYRYDGGDSTQRRILTSGFIGFAGQPLPISLSPGENLVYFIEDGGKLYAIDTEDGTTTVVSDLRDELPGVLNGFVPGGITVSEAEAIPATSEWGLLVMTLFVLTVGTLMLKRGGAPRDHVSG